MKNIYLDNAATTSIDPLVFRAMKPYLLEKYGNPSEYHTLGRQAREVIEKSREGIAKFLGAKATEMVFTSCATESINLAHKGLIEALRFALLPKNTPHIITSQIEHKAVLETCRHLEDIGWAQVTYLKVDRGGLVSLTELKKTIRENTVLVSVMYVNNEVGTIEPIGEIGRYLRQINRTRKQRIYFHTDATQAISYLNCKVGYLGVDFLSFTGHKINGPKGIGALYVKDGTPCVRQIDGGGQEKGRRAGTENVAFIVGLGEAIELAQSQKQKAQSVTTLRNKLIKGVLTIPGVKLTGHSIKRAPHIASFVVENVEGESLVLALSDVGIFASSGSACTSNDLAPSHVLTAMGYPQARSHGSIRFSLEKKTTATEIDYVLQKLPNIVQKLRLLSPIRAKI